MDLLTPMLVEEMIAIEGDDVADEAAVRIIRGRFDRDVCRAEKLRQLVRAHRHPAHDTEGASSAAFQSPEQIGIVAGIGDSNLAVGGDDFGFEQAARCGDHSALRSFQSRRPGPDLRGRRSGIRRPGCIFPLWL